MALTAVCAVLASCSEAAPERAIPDDMRWLESPSDPLAWAARGDVQLTAPIRPPTDAEETAHIVVYVHLPAGSQIVDGRMPVGSRAARVEYAGPAHAPDAPVSADWRVLDVRAFEWRGDHQECSVLRPGPRGSLVGLAWPCSEANDERAGAVLAELARAGHFAPRTAAARARAATHVARINGCTQCHAPDRAEDRRPGVLVQRGADGAGLFTLGSVLRDEDPAERYRPVDTNRDDPLITPSCPGGSLAADGERCRDGQWPRLRFDLVAGLAHGSVHARNVCDSRRAIARWIAPPHPETLSVALSPCTL